MYLLAGFLLRGKSRDRHFHFGTDQVANEILHTWGQYKTAFWLATKIHSRLDFANANYWDMKNRLQIDWLALTSKCSFRAIEIDTTSGIDDAKGTAFMLSSCLVSLITLHNDIILIVYGRKRFETVVRVLQSENGECHERIIMEPLWTLLSTFNKGRRRKIVHCSR